MIIVRVELHSAITGKISELARMVIDNTGGTETQGDYRVRTLLGRNKDALDQSWITKRVTREGTVTKHPRLAQHVWDLVGKALKAVRYGEDK